MGLCHVALKYLLNVAKAFLDLKNLLVECLDSDCLLVIPYQTTGRLLSRAKHPMSIHVSCAGRADHHRRDARLYATSYVYSSLSCIVIHVQSSSGFPEFGRRKFRIATSLRL